MDGRGRLMVNMIKKLNNNEPSEDLDNEHFQKMCKLNKNPDPTFVSHDPSPEQMLGENEYYYNNETDLIRDLASTSPLKTQVSPHLGTCYYLSPTYNSTQSLFFDT